MAMVAVHASGRAAAPDVPVAVAEAAKAVCRPTLKVDANSYEAGSAFLVAGARARPLLLTAQHLFGPDGGLAKAVTWQDMPAHARVVACKPLGRGPSLHEAPAIALPGAHPMTADDQGGAINDIAAFVVSPKDSAFPALTLAALLPKEGDRVWLVAEAHGSDTFAHAAHVLALQNGALVFAYDDPKLDLQATSGAPIVNAEGKVVGLNLGGGYDAEAKTVVGVGDDLAVLGKALATRDGHP